MGSIFYNIFIMPIELIFQILFSLVRDVPVRGIFLVSLVMNFLALPLYMRADAIQAEEREKVKSMSKWVEHIKKTFKGDERYMMLTEYYNSQNYKPIYSLRSSFSLLLQIPFFMAAYHFLSNVSSLNGQAFLIIKNLGAPDALVSVGGITVNVLPILMTLINVVSGYIYLRGFPIREKIQTYGIAVIFLVLLYDRPSGLVLYWTLNQVFSVLKNVFLKIFKERKTKDIVFSVFGILLAISILIYRKLDNPMRVAVFLSALLIPQIPLLISLFRKKFSTNKPVKQLPTSIFILSEVFVALLTGLVIPLSVISAEPEAFAFGENTVTKILTNNFTLSIGLFVVWMSVFYYLSDKKVKNKFTYVSVFLVLMSILNFMCFNKSFGTVSKELNFDKVVSFSAFEQLLNIAVLLFVAILIYFVLKNKNKIIKFLISFALLGLVGLISVNGIHTSNVLAVTRQTTNVQTSSKILNLSKKGKNVFILFLDRAISYYVPFMLNERPELEEKFDGFTYYPNTLSFGGNTNYAAPALYGGYEYTPAAMNERNNETLEKKHDEALRMLPTLFSNNGYNSVITNPPYAGYHNISDLSIFDNDNFKAYMIAKAYDLGSGSQFEETQLRNFFMYSIYQIMPSSLKSAVYDKGDYLAYDSGMVSGSFFEDFNKLNSLSKIINIYDDASNNFNFVENDSTHSPAILSTPEYSLDNVDKNKELNVDESLYQLPDGRKIEMKTEVHISHYHVNMASMLSVGRLMDYLRENGVYDNTRIIIVSDHSYEVNQIKALMFDDKLSIERFNPLLMVKDFNSKGFKQSDEFMTNADVATLATKDIISNPVNPFTGNPIDGHQKNQRQLITNAHVWDVETNNGTVFDTTGGQWWSVKNNIFDVNNWELVR